MSNDDYKRCAICDHCNLGEGVERRKFVLDKATNEYHCMVCVKEVQSAIDGSDYKPDRTPYWKKELNMYKSNIKQAKEREIISEEALEEIEKLLSEDID